MLVLISTIFLSPNEPIRYTSFMIAKESYHNLLLKLQNDIIYAHVLNVLTDKLSPLSAQLYPKSIFFAYLPKSGSTFFLMVLKELTGFTLSNLSWGYNQNEQNLHYTQFIKYKDSSHISKLMSKATDTNLMCLKLFAVKPVILTRPLSDIIISLHDHFETINPYWPQFFIPKDYDQFSKEKKLDLFIDHFTPWFIDFLVSWTQADDALNKQLLWLSYRDLTQNTQNSCEQVLAYYDIKGVDLTDIETIKTKSKIERFYYNKGIEGRGKATLSDKQLQRIESFFVHYPHLKKWI